MRMPAYSGRVCRRMYLRWIKQDAWYDFVQAITKAKGRI